VSSLGEREGELIKHMDVTPERGMYNTSGSFLMN